MTGSPTAPGTLSCQEAERLIGVLVLGVIDPEERPSIEAHLATCPACSATVADLAVLPGLLHRVDPALAVSGLPEVPPRLTARVVAAAQEAERVTRAQRRRRMELSTAAAVLVVLVLLAAGVVGTILRPHTSVVAVPPTPSTVVGLDAATGVRAEVTLAPRTSGTELTLALSGVASGEHCQLIAVDTAGRREVAATWVATYDGKATVVGTTSLPPSAITSLEVVTTDGQKLLSVPVGSSG